MTITKHFISLFLCGALLISSSGAFAQDRSPMGNIFGQIIDKVKEEVKKKPNTEEEEEEEDEAEDEAEDEDAAVHDEATGTSIEAAKWALAIAKLLGIEKEEEKLAIGALGFTSGYIFGHIAGRKREKYKTEIEYLDAQIKASNNLEARKENKLVKYEKELATQQKLIDDLALQSLEDAETIASLKRTEVKLAQSITELKRFNFTTEKTIEKLSSDIKDSVVDPSKGDTEKEVEKRLDSLRDQVEELKSLRERTLSTLSNFEASHEMVSALIGR